VELVCGTRPRSASLIGRDRTRAVPPRATRARVLGGGVATFPNTADAQVTASTPLTPSGSGWETVVYNRSISQSFKAYGWAVCAFISRRLVLALNESPAGPRPRAGASATSKAGHTAGIMKKQLSQPASPRLSPRTISGRTSGGADELRISRAKQESAGGQSGLSDLVRGDSPVRLGRDGCLPTGGAAGTPFGSSPRTRRQSGFRIVR